MSKIHTGKNVFDNFLTKQSLTVLFISQTILTFTEDDCRAHRDLDQTYTP